MSQQTIDHLAARQGTEAYWLVWIEGRNRETGAVESAGFWDGADHQVFVIDGQSRTYFGAGSLLGVDPIRAQAGLGIRVQQVTLTLTPEVEQAIRFYDPSLAPVEIHRATINPATGALVAEPTLAFAGTVDATPITEGTAGQPSSITIEAAGRERGLTRRTPAFRSDAALRVRSATDSFRRYGAEVQRWTVPWGENAVTGGGPVRPPPEMPPRIDGP